MAIALFEGAGARCLSPAQLRTWGDEAAYFADPDGNVLVVATTPRAADARPGALRTIGVR